MTSINRARIASSIFIIATAFAATAFSQQGWSRINSVKQGGAAATINAVFYDGDDIWVVGANGYAARSYDDARTFQESNVGVSDGLNDVFVRKERIWVVGDGGLILRSTDSGRSWLKSFYSSRQIAAADPQNPSGGVDLYSVQFINEENGYIVGDHGLILATSNGGASWREQRSSTDAQLFHLSFQGERGWVVGTGGLILHTDNGGRNWYPQRSGTQDDLNRVYFVSEEIGLITGDNGTLLRSANGGATWERVTLNVAEPLFGISFIDRRTGWVVGYNGRIVRTYDGGRSWVEQDSATTTDLFAVSFKKNRGYAIGRDGVILRYYERR
jgi:photosystem II stability/assembly factor-like uncharacterized protein